MCASQHRKSVVLGPPEHGFPGWGKSTPVPESLLRQVAEDLFGSDQRAFPMDAGPGERLAEPLQHRLLACGPESLPRLFARLDDTLTVWTAHFPGERRLTERER